MPCTSILNQRVSFLSKSLRACCVLGAAVLLAGTACSKAQVGVEPAGGGSGQSGGRSGSGSGAKGGSGGDIFGSINFDASPPVTGKGCGNGVIDQSEGEGCDDGNKESGDGCNAICQQEANWVCKTPGQPCENIAVCGNGILTSNETCDDGNTNDGDGCSKDCKTIEPGWQCRVPGKKCTPKCGDGVVSGTETCDDGNTKSGDGCSSTCHLELGYKCDGGNPTTCSKTVCGDGKKEGAESCDDGNAIPFDGCSMDCQIEPACKAGEGCSSQCGDAIVLGEKCDDGNVADGDGCSKDCKVEPGWTCSQPPIGESMKVPVVYRDFKFQNPTDFQAGVSGSYDPLTGIVKDALDDKGKPVYTGNVSQAHIASQATFSQWYTNVSGVNHATASRLVLWNDGKGNFVNRYSENGDQWNTTAPANYCGTVTDALLDENGDPIPCTFKYQYDPDASPNGGKTDCQKMEDQGYTRLPGSCHSDNGTYKALYIVGKADGNPLFFPVDGDTFTPASELKAATIPPYYDASATWPKDKDANGKEKLHNFSFTSEVRYWFPYDKSKTYTLDFVGDDDVWVFINGKLAVDLGGVHTPVDGQVVIGANGNGTTTVIATYPLSPAPKPTKQTATLGLQDGKVYEIAVFQAERQTDGSSYKLTLGGFNAAPSTCLPACGDGEIVADEECDCGDSEEKVHKDRCPGMNNNDTYGGCTTECKWGGYCGDGVVNGPEQCDEGPNNGTDKGNGCTAGCTKAHYCGDGNVDTDRGEQCDLGEKNGQSLCAKDCRFIAG